MDERSVIVAVQTASSAAAEALRQAAIRCAKGIYLPEGRRNNGHAQFHHGGHPYRLYYLDDLGPGGGPAYVVLPARAVDPARRESEVCCTGPGVPSPWPVPLIIDTQGLPGYGWREQQELR